MAYMTSSAFANASAYADAAITTGLTSSGLAGQVWPVWVSGPGSYTETATMTCSNANAQVTWPVWVEATANYATQSLIDLPCTYTVWNCWYDTQCLTDEQKKAYVEAQEKSRLELEEQLRKQEVERKAQEEKRKVAAARAKELLLRLLDPDQEKDYVEKGTFELRTDKTRYRIKPGDRVEELNPEGRVTARFCIHPCDHWMPREDWAIAQKLMLETDEETFLRTANRSVA